MGFLIRLESVASPQTPEDAVRELATMAARLGVGVIAFVNAAEAFAFPGEDPDEVVRRWKLDGRFGPTVASVTRKRAAARKVRR